MIRNCAEFFLSCGKGTYVRSIARDIGNALGCFAHAKDIRRLSSGGFDIKDSISLSLLQTLEENEILDFILPTQEVLKFMTEIKCNDSQFIKIRNGIPVKSDIFFKESSLKAWASYRDIPIAVGTIDGNVFHPKRVLQIIKQQEPFNK